jgi:hypothetical protein
MLLRALLPEWDNTDARHLLLGHCCRADCAGPLPSKAATAEALLAERPHTRALLTLFASTPNVAYFCKTEVHAAQCMLLTTDQTQPGRRNA